MSHKTNTPHSCNVADSCTTLTQKSPLCPRLWLFWMDGPDDARGYSSRALQFVDVERGDLILVDGRGDQQYVQDVATRRGIPFDRIHVSQNTELPFSAQITRFETERIARWVCAHTTAIVLVPASTCTESFAEFHHRLRREASPDLDIYVEGEDLAWAMLFGNKGIVHPRLSDGAHATSLLQRALDDTGSGDVRVPRGFLCRGREEIREAWRRLGNASVALKEVSSSGGVGVHFLHDEADLDQLEVGSEEIIVEEDLRLRHAHLQFLTIHYEGNQMGPVMEQQFMRDALGQQGTLYSGSRTIAQNTSVVQRIRNGMQRVVTRLSPHHLGGFDVAVGDNEALYILDVNSARFNGSHTAIAAMRWRFPHDAHFSCFKIIMPSSERFDRLRERVCDLEWCEPVCYDGQSGRWVVAGASPEQCAEREDMLRSALLH